MDNEEYSELERGLIARLPALPPVAELRASNIWIIEWLPEGEQKTGQELHRWMERSKPGWSIHIHCNSKADVLRAIERATAFVCRTRQNPVLHLEAHGDEWGLAGPNGAGSFEQLTWDELIGPLQALNVETLCNLLVVIAACEGFAGISALTRGPRAPALVLVGPTDRLPGSDLSKAMKEFYRRLQDQAARMREMVDSASRETMEVDLEFEPFATLFYESLTHDLIRRLRRAKMHPADETGIAPDAILPSAAILQRIWDEMFMFDLNSENRSRFALDMTLVIGPFHDELRIHQEAQAESGRQHGRCEDQ